MSLRIRRVDYFFATVPNEPEEAYKVLSALADVGINLLAFAGVPVGHHSTQLTLFPEESTRMQTFAKNSGLALEGPHSALLAQGDDRLGALADIHRRLHDADVNVSASTGVVDGAGTFGYVLYIRSGEIDRAIAALKPR